MSEYEAFVKLGVTDSSVLVATKSCLILADGLVSQGIRIRLTVDALNLHLKATKLGGRMLLEGSCHCGSVKFRVHSPSPYPYLICYCSICRKTAGGGGYAINLGAHSESLEVEGEENLSVYRARMRDSEGGVEISPGERSFCKHCASALWVYDPRWPELLHPFASAIDTPLPRPPEKVRMMLNYAAPWAEIPTAQNERHFPEFPDESLEDWHRRHDLYDES